jgi:hypothetical protein
MVPADGSLVDLTGNGNDGTPGAFSVVEPTILGNFRRYLPNSGALGTTLGGANAFPLGDLTVFFWYLVEQTSTSTGWLVNYFQNTSDAWGIRIINGTSIGIFDDIDNAGASLYTTTVPRGKLISVAAVMDGLENRLFIDKTLAGSGTSSSDDWSSFPGILYHGDRETGAASAPTDGIVSPIFLFNEAKDQAWVTAEDEKGAQAIPFMTDFGVQESLANQTGGRLGGPGNMSPFEIISGTWNIGHEWIDGILMKVNRCVAPGVVALPTKLFDTTPTGAAYGTPDFWVKKADASVTYVIFIASDKVAWNGASQNGYAIQLNNTERVILGRITAGVFTNLSVSDINTVTPGAWHRITPPRRYNGQFTTYLDGVQLPVTGGSNPVTDNTHTTSYYTVLDFDAGDEFAYCDERGGHRYTKFEGFYLPFA